MTKVTMADQACIAMAEYERNWTGKIRIEDFIDGVRKIPIKRFEVEAVYLSEELLEKVYPGSGDNLWLSIFPDNSAFIWEINKSGNEEYLAINNLSKQTQREIKTSLSKKPNNKDASKIMEKAQSLVAKLQIEIINLLEKEVQDNPKKIVIRSSLHTLLDSLNSWENSSEFIEAEASEDYLDALLREVAKKNVPPSS